VVIPVHCEAEVLPAALSSVRDVLQKVALPYEVVVVDDGSTDATWQVIGDFAEHEPALRGLRLSRRFGKEAALRAGLETVRGNAAITMDGDLQHPPELIPDMVAAWRGGADIVEAVKEDRSTDGAIESLRARIFYGLLRRLSGHDLDGASDFKLLDQRVLRAYLSLGERNIFFRGMVAWLGFKSVRLPFSVPRRAAGRSSWTFVGLVRLAVTAVTSFSSLPLQFVTILGVCLLTFSFAMGVQTLYRKLSGSALDGFTTVILLLLIIGSTLMVALGIIGEYIARIYDEVKGRPRYLIGETLDGNDRQTK